MEQRVIIIEESQIEVVKEILENHRINYREAGFPNGIVTVSEKYESEMNQEKHNVKRVRSTHEQRRKFAQHLGCKDIPEAIVKVGGGINFNRRFKAEFEKV